MTLHTPGPWTAHGTSVAKETSGHVGRSEYPIAEVWKNLPYEEGCANARLIASCPTMLEALNRLDDELTHSHEIIPGTDLHDLIRAAIAKATNEGNHKG